MMSRLHVVAPFVTAPETLIVSVPVVSAPGFSAEERPLRRSCAVICLVMTAQLRGGVERCGAAGGLTLDRLSCAVAERPVGAFSYNDE